MKQKYVLTYSLFMIAISTFAAFIFILGKEHVDWSVFKVILVAIPIGLGYYCGIFALYLWYTQRKLRCKSQEKSKLEVTKYGDEVWLNDKGTIITLTYK